MAGALFVASNLAIMLGYIFLASIVVPRVPVKLLRTKLGGVGFFSLCGLHHLDQVLHYVFQPAAQIQDVYTELHMVGLDIPQAVCVWMFVTGLYIEMVRWGPWGQETAGDPSEP